MIYIIIPTYNRAYTLSRALTSCLAQEGNFMIIVVDDGSTDNTRLLIDEYRKSNPGKIIYQFQSNGGVSSACNSGIKIALKHSKNSKIDYITRLGSDDELSENAILIYNKYITKYPDNDLFFFEMINGEGGSHSLIANDEKTINYKEYLSGQYISGPDADGLMKLSALENKSNRFVEGLHGGDNIAFQKIIKLQNQCVVIKENTYIAHIDTSSMTRSKITKYYSKQILDVQLKILEIFYDDYLKYNKKLIGIHSLIVARSYGILGQYKQAVKYLILGIKYNPLDFKRITLALIALFPYSLSIINLIIYLFITRKVKKG